MVSDYGSGRPHGVAKDGTHDTHSLAVQGWVRAGALAGLFGPVTTVLADATSYLLSALGIRAIGGTDDHVHILMALLPRISVAQAVRVIKANSSKWMNETGHLFAWQQGYGVFSVSASNLPAVCDYIGRQEEHHQKRSFADEFQEFLRKHGIVATSATKMAPFRPTGADCRGWVPLPGRPPR